MVDQTPLITGVDFVYVPTRDFAAAEHFYETVLGLPRVAKYGSHPGGEFETGNLTIQVLEAEAFGLEFTPSRNPIALHVEDIEAARLELESRGVTFSGEIDSGVCHMAHFQDPDGNQLMLHNRYAPKPAAG
jgi:catechol 2,3-dioxygenase-like lactoylglutathione lyase family enzyme